MPFNQGMSLPLELGLCITPDGPRLTWQPVDELKGLRSRSIFRWSGEIQPGDNPLAGIGGERMDPRGI